MVVSKNSIIRWLVFGLVLSLCFVFVPRIETLGYTPYESRERFGLTWGIYSVAGQIQIPEIFVNFILGIFTTLLLLLMYKLVLSKIPITVSITLLTFFIGLFLLFPGKELGTDYNSCPLNADCSGEEVELTTYGLVGDTFSSEYRAVGSDYKPDMPIIYWNLILALISTSLVGISYRIFSHYFKPTK